MREITLNELQGIAGGLVNGELSYSLFKVMQAEARREALKAGVVIGTLAGFGTYWLVGTVSTAAALPVAIAGGTILGLYGAYNEYQYSDAWNDLV